MTPDAVLKQLHDLGDVQTYFIAQENHAPVESQQENQVPEEHKGEDLCQYHIHAYCGYDVKKYILYTALTLKGEDGTEYKGNYQACRSVASVISYCSKDGKYLTNIEDKKLQALFKKAAKEKLSYDDVIAKARAGDTAEAFETILIVNPRDVIMKGPAAIKANLTALDQTRSNPLDKGFKWLEPGSIETWDCTKYALVLVGQAGCGKSNYAKSFFKSPCVCTHLEGLQAFDPVKHDGLVFDDMSFYDKPPELSLHLSGVEDQPQINIKYGHVVIPRGTPRVFVHNKWPFSKPVPPQLRRRVHVVLISQDLRDRDEQQVEAQLKPPDELYEALAFDEEAQPFLYQE